MGQNDKELQAGLMPPGRRRSVRALGAAGLATVLTCGGLVTLPEAAFAAASGDGTRLLAGSVRDASGEVPDEAYATVTLWPSQTEGHERVEQTGEEVAAEALLLDSVRVGEDGTFVLEANLETIEPSSEAVAKELEALLRGDPVDILIESYTIDSSNILTSTVRFDPATNSLRPQDPAAPAGNAEGDPAQVARLGSMSSNGVEANFDDEVIEIAMPLIKAEQPGYRIDENEAALQRAAPHINCYTTMNDFPAVPTIVGSLMATAGSGFSAQFVNTNGAETALGSGFSTSGEWGSYSTSGTTTRSTGNSSTWPARTTSGGDTYITNFSYGLYQGRGCFSGPIVPPMKYFTQAYQHYGGQAKSTRPANSSRGIYCASYLNGGSLSVDSGWGINYSDGVNLQGYIGVSLQSAQRYSSAAKYNMSFSSNRQVCGYTGPIGSSNVGEITIR